MRAKSKAAEAMFAVSVAVWTSAAAAADFSKLTVRSMADPGASYLNLATDTLRNTKSVALTIESVPGDWMQDKPLHQRSEELKAYR